MYTKGKWYIAKDGYTITTKERAGLYIAQVHPFDIATSTGKDNANLIAAAPDLLEACKLMQDALTEHNLRDCKKRFSLCVADATISKAVAKAEGKL